jgi:hypothetical protein
MSRILDDRYCTLSQRYYSPVYLQTLNDASEVLAMRTSLCVNICYVRQYGLVLLCSSVMHRAGRVRVAGRHTSHCRAGARSLGGGSIVMAAPLSHRTSASRRATGDVCAW